MNSMLLKVFNFAALSISVLLAAVTSPASAQHDPGVHAAAVQTQGPVRIEEAWARATPPGGKVGGAFVTLVNAACRSSVVAGVSGIGSSRYWSIPITPFPRERVDETGHARRVT